jgi:hypothetical protein
MSSEAHDRLTTADMVAAGEPDMPSSDRTEERSGNVRRMERRPDPRGTSAESDQRPGALLPSEEGGQLRHRWDTIQTAFVDEPRQAVEEADSLVAQTMKRVAEVFAQERASLEQQWTRGEDVSTEDLRLALKRYRSFFDRLLAA